MNTLNKISILILAIASLVSCVEKEEPVVYLEVNAHNISGSWKLAQWNGTALNDSTYMYVEFVRNDRTFTIWQNMDSFMDVPHKTSGSFYIDYDMGLGAIIRGQYDNDSGDWAHRYIVKELTATSMKWIARDDMEYIQIFERVDSIRVAPVEK